MYPYPWPQRPPPNPLRWLNPLVVILVLIAVLVITVELLLPIAFWLALSNPSNLLAALSTPLMVLVVLVVQDSVMVFVPYLVYFKTRIMTWAELGLVKMSGKDAVNRVGLGLIAGLAYAGAVMAITKFIDYQTSGGVPLGKLDSPANYIFMMLGGAVIAPIAEEFFFRGVALKGVMNWLKYKESGYAFGFALLFSSTLFAVIHLYDTFGTVVVFIGGIVFAVLYYKTDSLVTPMVAHAAYNGVLITAEYLKFN